MSAAPSISTFALPTALVRIAQRAGVCPHDLLERIERELGCSWCALTRPERGQVILTLVECGVSGFVPTPSSNASSSNPASSFASAPASLLASSSARQREGEQVKEGEMVVDYSQNWGA